MVSSTAANSLNQPTPRSEFQAPNYLLQTAPRVTMGGNPPCALGGPEPGEPREDPAAGEGGPEGAA